MTGSLEAPHPNGSAQTADDPPSRPWRRRAFAAALVVVAIAWGYAIWYSVTRDSPEALDETARTAVASGCTDAVAALRALPDLSEDPIAEDAVELVRDENAVFASMVDEFRAVAPDDSDAADALAKWADDWDAVIAARAAFANDLEADGTARLEIPAVEQGGVRPITDRMDEYSQARGLDDCIAVSLQIEVVDGPRIYPDQED